MSGSIKKKPTISGKKYGTRCLCSDKTCDDAMKKLQKHNPDRYAYFALPKEPKSVASLTKAPRPDALVNRTIKSLNRERFLNALPLIATIRANDDEYNISYQFGIASLHFHDDVYNLGGRRGNGKLDLPNSIPATLANSLNGKGYVFTSADKHADGTYVPLPNVPPIVFKAYTDDLEKRATQAQAAPTAPSAKRKATRTPPVTTETLVNEILNDSIAERAAQIELEKISLAKQKKELLDLQKQLDDQQADIAALITQTTINPATLSELMTTLKTHVVSQVGAFLDKSTARFGSRVARSIFDAATFEFPFLMEVSWEAERKRRVARSMRAIDMRNREFGRKAVEARQREMKIESFRCKTDGCKGCYDSGCLEYCKKCFKSQTNQEVHESKRKSISPKAGNEDSRVCKSDGCYLQTDVIHQPNWLGYCTSCFKFYSHQERNMIAWEGILPKQHKESMGCKTNGCKKWKVSRCSEYCVQCFKINKATKKEAEVCKADECSKLRHPNHNGYCGQCYSSYYHNYFDQGNRGVTIAVTGMDSNESTRENASLLPRRALGINESQLSMKDEEDVGANSEDEEERQKPREDDDGQASGNPKEEKQGDLCAQQAASIDKFVRGRMGHVIAFPASRDTQPTVLLPMSSSTAECMGHSTTPSPAEGRAAQAVRQSAAAMALEITTPAQKKRKRSPADPKSN